MSGKSSSPCTGVASAASATRLSMLAASLITRSLITWPLQAKPSLMTLENVKNVAGRASDQLRRRRGTPSRAGRQHDVAPAFELSKASRPMSEAELVCIPVVDVREGGAVRHALDARARARALRDDCVTWLPRAARMLLPAMDALTRRWLQRSHSPYVTDLEAIAVALGFPGIWFLNGTYQWGCTAVARDEDGVPWLARTLDWPFPGLGRHIEIARMRGPAGEFVNLTWPGYAGALTALAPGRFAAAIN